MKRIILIVLVSLSLISCTLTDWFYRADQPIPAQTPLPFTVSPVEPPTLTPIPSATPTDGFIPAPSPTFTATLPDFTDVPSLSRIPVPARGVYMPFQRGFMVYVEGANCLYAYTDRIIIPLELNSQPMGRYHYCLEFDNLPDVPNDAPQNTPEGVFGRVWNRYADLQAALGESTRMALAYETTIPPSESVSFGGMFYVPVIELPDGRGLYCGARAATAGECQLRALPY